MTTISYQSCHLLLHAGLAEAFRGELLKFGHIHYSPGAICRYAMARLAEPREPDAPVRCSEAESGGGGGWEPGRWY